MGYNHSMIDEKAIVAKIAQLLGTVNGLSVVFQGRPQTISSYPAAIIEPGKWKDEYQDLAHTTRSEDFVISIYKQLTTDSVNEMQAFWDLVKSIHSVLNSQTNIQLGGLIDYSELTAGAYQYDEKESSLYFVQIVYSAKKAYSRF